jgi:hypothetical protein
MAGEAHMQANPVSNATAYFYSGNNTILQADLSCTPGLTRTI